MQPPCSGPRRQTSFGFSTYGLQSGKNYSALFEEEWTVPPFTVQDRVLPEEVWIMFIQLSAAIAANSVNDNIIAGNQFEFAPTRAIVDFGLVASAIGLEIDVLIGSRAVVTRMLPSIQNRWPVFPDDYPLRSAAQAGERIIIRVRNTTVGALTIFSSTKFTPR